MRAIGVLCIFNVAIAALDSFIGSNYNLDVVPNTYLLEFSNSQEAVDGKHHIIDHLTKTKKYSADAVIFHSSTRTKLYHAYSFHVSEEVNEQDILSIPEAISAHKVIKKKKL